MENTYGMNIKDIDAFPTIVANEPHVSAFTHNQALSALLLLYREVLGISRTPIEQPQAIPTNRSLKSHKRLARASFSALADNG
jgi:hypothetical protein